MRANQKENVELLNAFSIIECFQYYYQSHNQFLYKAMNLYEQNIQPVLTAVGAY